MERLRVGQIVKVIKVTSSPGTYSPKASRYAVGDNLIITSDEGIFFSATNLRTGGADVRVYDSEVEVVTIDIGVNHKRITFGEIQKGDLIKSSYTDRGVLKERTGIANDYTALGMTTGWAALSGDFVALKSWDMMDVVYQLLERKEVKKFEDAEVGSVAITNPGKEVYYKVRENEWALVRISHGDLSAGYLTDDQILAERCDLITPPKSD